MDKFDIYEFSALLLPGAIALYGLALLYPELRLLVHNKDFTFGTLGLYVVLSFAAGHLIQAVGNQIEKISWIKDGKPSDWVRQGMNNILIEDQRENLKKLIVSELSYKKIDFKKTSQEEWENITREIYIFCRNQDKTKRIDIFNANYGLYRGLAASLLLLSLAIYIKLGNSHLWLSAILAALAFLSIYRMQRFSIYYAKELFMQFLHSYK
ncbi:hypothetical protein A3E69_04220 [Candidatus Roizmanbacteria bacterium RIFCSPHIGHO2_12_FULL_40_130]|nr:MAG: hypothetical protein A2779_01280 [Candidatus Roizmanbacteria bacterium RIFCSPHIGHO2_01_FULL_40_98]OGK28994.1 MAG: hypothetical protein A3C31_01920 [Candidatus Roizmanbacteria bacterium RIFCSPHIGHO2_02_FULL_40_53]OGK37281.1 MAG: hypothetical protein A3E69_04220 [Candidatus Roizmanbacteria bacterium RIFCSPHIGHO2_12_FULL_40_130]